MYKPGRTRFIQKESIVFVNTASPPKHSTPNTCIFVFSAPSYLAFCAHNLGLCLSAQTAGKNNSDRVLGEPVFMRPLRHLTALDLLSLGVSPA